MGYREETERMNSYLKKDGKFIRLKPDNSNEKENYRVISELSNHKKIAIRFPGYKTSDIHCDYCVYLVDGNVESPISHVQIMQDLHDKTTEDNYLNMKAYIEAVADIGIGIKPEKYTRIDFNHGFTFEELTGLMFYIAIQEDINYAKPYYQGRKMCFYRYIEAIYSKMHQNHSLSEAMGRASEKGHIPKNWEDVGALYDNIAAIKR